MGERIRAAVVPYFRRREFVGELLMMGYALAVAGVWPPLAPAVVCAAWLVPVAPYWALCGAVGGCLISGELEGGIAAALFVAAGLLVSIWKPLKTLDKLVCLGAAQFVLLPLYHMKNAGECVLGLFGIAASVLFAVLLRRAVSGLRLARGARLVLDTDQLCIAVAAALFIAALGGIAPFGIRLCAVLAAAAALFCVRIKGAGAVVVAVLAGAACAIRGGVGMELAGCLAACTLVCALSGGHRWAAPALFAVCASVCALRVEGALTHIECGIACSLCMALPERWISAARAAVTPEERLRCERELQALRGRVSDMARVLKSLASLQIGSFASRQLEGAGSALAGMAEEEPPRRRRFSLHCGAAACPKAGSPDTGDCMGIRRTGGSVALLLSDGMGTGAEAHRESATAVALSGDLIEVGFELYEALECVNRLLINKGAGSDMYATLDAVMIDLFTGAAHFIKYGAPPCCILRGDKLHLITASALPVGILEEARPALNEVCLKRGDTVVMMTDGVYDALGGDLEAAVLKNAALGTEDEAAEGILRCAAEKDRRDDMTVMVARIT